MGSGTHQNLSCNADFFSTTVGIETLLSLFVILFDKECPFSNALLIVSFNENIPFAVGSGTTIPFYKQSRLLASGHSFEYIGSGTNLIESLPSRGGVAVQENEVDDRNGGLTIFTSTDQAGNFRIGDGVVIDQQSGTITGTFYSKSLFSTITPFILALGGD